MTNTERQREIERLSDEIGVKADRLETLVREQERAGGGITRATVAAIDAATADLTNAVAGY